MTSTTRRVPPFAQPLRPAIALGVVSLLLVVMTVVGVAAALLAVGYLGQASMDEGFATVVVVLTLVAVAFTLVMVGLGIAALVLSILVIVKGDGKLRLGAILLLAATVLGTAVSFSTSGDPSQLSDAADALASLASLLGLLVDVAQIVAMIVGLVLLGLGIREVRRARARVVPRP
jgi:amino acid transporter